MIRSFKKAVEWARQFESSNRWLNSVLAEGSGSENTEGQYARNFQFYCKFVGKSPDDLIAERKEQLRSDSEVERHKAEDMLQDAYLKVKRKGKKGKAVLMVRTVKSFYEHNFVALDMKDPKVAFSERLPISLEDLRTLYDAAKPKIKAWICILKDTGLSRSDALRLSYGQIKKAFEKGETFIPVHLIREKTQTRHVTFLGPNAIDALKLYFRELQVKGIQITEDTALINSKGKRATYDSLGKTLERFGKRYGIKLSTHRIRKFFITAMALGKVHPIITKYWAGHKVGSDIDSSYIIPSIPEQLQLYREAYKNIDLTGSRLEERLKTIEEIMAIIPPEQKEKMKKFGISFAKRKSRAYEELQKKAKSAKEESEDCPDGVHCGEFKQITESELLAYLQEGWTVAHKLGNGEVIVKR